MNFRLFFVLIYTCFFVFSQLQPVKGQGQQRQESDFIGVCIGFYNVENLFDTISDPVKLDDEFTPDGINRWTSNRYGEKLENIARVISLMGVEFNPDGPAVLGLSEVENRAVLTDLAGQERIRGRNYQVVHYEGPDARGVDVAFLYQPKYFTYIGSKPYPSVVKDMPGFLTRDQLLLTGELLGERMHFIVSHWPSRRGGERRSRPLRIAMADIARHIIDSIQDAEPGAKIILMGDLNDNPTDIAVRNHLRAKGKSSDMKGDELFNPFENLFRKGIGSNAWRDTWSLFDQILLNPAFLDTGFDDFMFYKAEVYNAPFLRQPSGRFQGYPFRSYGGGVYLGGYSDHFPTLVYLIRKK
jgi:hypothetical protein